MSQTRMLRKFHDAIPADVKEKFMETFMKTLGPGEEFFMGGQLEHLEMEHGSGGCRVEPLPDRKFGQQPHQKDQYRGR